jgi:hypothetical protein
MSEGSFNPAARRLCPDGACIGVIGADGRCRVCGRAGDGAAAIATGGAFADDARNHDSNEDPNQDRNQDRYDHADADADADGRRADGEQDGGAGAFRPDRRLCEDGSCVGVIGAGDICSVCGRPAGS